MSTPPPSSRPPFETVSRCPHCGGVSAHPFATAGVCLRCAGERVLELDSGDGGGATARATAGLAALVRGTDGLPLAVGPYEIIEEIGHGGMGRVYAARQAGLERIVALKVLPEGRGGVAGLELRFLREAQTAARLRHPHIVNVHDSGRADGHVYFSMDYVEGGDLARRLREGPVPPREAARLVRKLAAALAYTHAEGVLHRDVKPSNILLDGGEPKLADFGLAAQLEPGGDLTARSGVLGTPHYLAPEALRGGSAALSAVSDLYALGVVLYEMLTGRPPFAGAAPAELVALLETHEPPPLRLLAPAVPRDLETVCLKCLEREPGRRYASASALEEDLRRFEAGEPILARAPGRIGAFRKFAARHRAALGAAVTIVVVLVAATIVSVSLAYRARRAEQVAGAEARTSRELAAFLQNDLLAQASPDLQPDRDLRLRVVLDRAAEKIDERLAGEPLAAAAIRETLAGTYSALGEIPAEERQLRAALELRRRYSGREAPETFTVMVQLAVNLMMQGRKAEAAPLGRDGSAGLVRVLGDGDVRTLHALNDLVFIEKALGRLGPAEALARRTLAAARRAVGAGHEETRAALSNLSSILWTEGKYPEAEAGNLEALAAYQAALGAEHPETLSVMSNLASVYWSQGKVADAERINHSILETRRRVIGPEHPETLRSMNNLATTYLAAGKFDEAVALQRQTLEIRRRLLGPEHPDTVSAMHNLAQALLAQGRLADALALCAGAHEIAGRTLGPEHFATLGIADSLAELEFLNDRTADAIALAQATREAFTRLLGPTNPKTLNITETLAAGLAHHGRPQEAEPLWRDVIARREKLTPDGWRLHVARSQLGETLTAQRRLAEAEPLLLEAWAGLRRVAGTIPPNQRGQVTRAGMRIVQLYADSGRPAEAEAWRAKQAAGGAGAR